MEATKIINLQVSPESLIQAVSSLDLGVRRQLVEIIEQPIFEAEEAAYGEDAETIAEIDAVQAEYDRGEFMTIDDHVQPAST